MTAHSTHRRITCRRTRSPLDMILQALAIWRQRRHLARLDSAALRDMGISPDEARKEAGRSLWDVPNHWRR